MASPKNFIGKIGRGIDHAVDGATDILEGISDVVTGAKDKVIDVLSIEKPKGTQKARNKALKYLVNGVYGAGVVTPIMRVNAFGAGIPLTMASVGFGRDLLGHSSGLVSALTELNGEKAVKAFKGMFSSTFGKVGGLVESLGRYVRTGDFKVAGVNGKDMSYDQVGRRNYDPIGNDVFDNSSLAKIVPFKDKKTKGSSSKSTKTVKTKTIPRHRKKSTSTRRRARA